MKGHLQEGAETLCGQTHCGLGWGSNEGASPRGSADSVVRPTVAWDSGFLRAVSG